MESNIYYSHNFLLFTYHLKLQKLLSIIVRMPFYYGATNLLVDSIKVRAHVLLRLVALLGQATSVFRQYSISFLCFSFYLLLLMGLLELLSLNCQQDFVSVYFHLLQITQYYRTHFKINIYLYYFHVPHMG